MGSADDSELNNEDSDDDGTGSEGIAAALASMKSSKTTRLMGVMSGERLVDGRAFRRSPEKHQERSTTLHSAMVRLYKAAEVPPDRRHLDPVSHHLTDCYLHCPAGPVHSLVGLLPRLP